MSCTFFFDNNVIARAREVKKYAESLSRRFRTVMYVTPEDPGFKLEAYGVTATFSMTQSGPFLIHRHLSVCASVNDELQMPNMTVVFTLGYYFGFLGVSLNPDGLVGSPSQDWIIRHFPDECTSLLSQRIAMIN